MSVAPFSVLVTPKSGLPLFQDAHFQMSQCMDHSDAFVCRAGDTLLNYSCPICNFKGRGLEVLSHCHAANITLYFFFYFNFIFYYHILAQRIYLFNISCEKEH